MSMLPTLPYIYAPPDVSRYVWWFESDSGVTVDGSNNVSILADQSPNGRDLYQSDPSLRPIYATNIMNGHPAIQYTASQMLKNTAITGIGGLSAFTRTMLFQLSALYNSTVFGTSTRALEITIYNQLMITLKASGSSLKDDYTSSIFPTSPTILTVIYDGSQTGDTNRVRVYWNGIQQTMLADNPGYPSQIDTFTEIYQNGWNQGGSPSNTTGYIVFDAMAPFVKTSADRLATEQYLGVKYGITVATS